MQKYLRIFAGCLVISVAVFLTLVISVLASEILEDFLARRPDVRAQFLPALLEEIWDSIYYIIIGGGLACAVISAGWLWHSSILKIHDPLDVKQYRIRWGVIASLLFIAPQILIFTAGASSVIEQFIGKLGVGAAGVPLGFWVIFMFWLVSVLFTRDTVRAAVPFHRCRRAAMLGDRLP